jgi:hypothetical protein
MVAGAGCSLAFNFKSQFRLPAIELPHSGVNRHLNVPGSRSDRPRIIRLRQQLMIQEAKSLCSVAERLETSERCIRGYRGTKSLRRRRAKMVGDEEKLQASDKKTSFLYRILRGGKLSYDEGKSKEEIFTDFQPLLKSSLSNRKTVSSNHQNMSKV